MNGRSAGMFDESESTDVIGGVRTCACERDSDGDGGPDWRCDVDVDVAMHWVT